MSSKGTARGHAGNMKEHKGENAITLKNTKFAFKENTVPERKRKLREAYKNNFFKFRPNPTELFPTHGEKRYIGPFKKEDTGM